MIALVKDKENFTKQKEVTHSDLNIVAIKTRWGIIAGYRVLFSIQGGSDFISSKNFARKTWATFAKAAKALSKIQEADLPIFMCENRLDTYFECLETERIISTKYKEEYGSPIKTYYVT